MSLLLAFASARAYACSIEAPVDFVAVDGDDVVPPGPPTDIVSSVHRGSCSEEACGGGDCADLGSISLRFAPAVDDQTGPDAIGYALRVVEGTTPDGFWIGETPTLSRLGDDGVGDLGLSWGDEATNTQEAFDFVLGIVALDAVGNESAEVTVRVSDPGSVGEDPGEEKTTPGTCGLPGVASGAAALLAALAAAGRRRVA